MVLLSYAAFVLGLERVDRKIHPKAFGTTVRSEGGNRRQRFNVVEAVKTDVVVLQEIVGLF